MENILVCVDSSPQAVSCCDHALAIAKMGNAHVDVLYISDIRAFESCAVSGLEPDGATTEVLGHLRVLEELKAKRIEKNVRGIFQCGNYGKHVDFHHLHGFILDIIGEFTKNERGIDFIVIGRRGEHSGNFKEHIGSTAERIIKASTVPCLVAAEKHTAAKRIMVAYDGSEHSEAAVKNLLGFGALFRGEVHLVTVETENVTPAGKAPLEKFCQSFKDVGINTITATLSGRVDEAIVRYIEMHSIDMLIMGAYGHSGIRHLFVGSNTTKILASTSITAIVCHNR
ncbi:MAG: universal stress protein [Puniceicoccales bacterium]|jgi:nucleotide-binding universal stress UspA family protein|nr:universal stress protein [Puniceicoccales bacterium]